MAFSVSLLILAFAIIHVAEEFFLGWLFWIRQFTKGITRTQFFVWNSAFILLCLAGLFYSSATFRLSIASLLLINAIVHLIPTLIRRQYSSGLISALLLYIPIGYYYYFSAIHHTLANNYQILVSIPLGALWMSLPFLYQQIRTYRLSA